MNTSKPRKIHILDTSALVYDASAFRSFPNSTVIIPLVVLEELDKVKKLTTEAGKNARVAIRYLDEISGKGDIVKGIDIGDDTTLFIYADDVSAIGSDSSYGDNQILGVTKKIRDESADVEVVLVSRDINLRVRAKVLGVTAVDYTNTRDRETDLYTGIQTVADEEMGASLLSYGEILDEESDIVRNMHPNECIVFTTEEGEIVACGRKMKDYVKLVNDKDAWGLQPRSAEQRLAIDMILDPKIPLVSLVGLAGGGKSLVSVACGLELVVNQKKYATFSIYRPIQSMGNEIGFLPGSQEEKLSPWFAAIDDAFALLLSSPRARSKDKEGWKQKLWQYTTDGTIQKEALSYIRGRSLPNSFILIDEAQNLSKSEIKTIITRVGMGSKIILTGDPSQIDAPHLDATSNGLSYLVDKFQGSELSGHITFSKGERSALASEAAKLL